MNLKAPIYFSTGLTEKANHYYKLFITWTNQKIRKTFVQRNMFEFKHIKAFDRAFADNPGPMVRPWPGGVGVRSSSSSGACQGSLPVRTPPAPHGVGHGVLEETGVRREGVWVEQEALMVDEDQVCSEPGSRSGVAWAALTAPWSPLGRVRHTRDAARWAVPADLPEVGRE